MHKYIDADKLEKDGWSMHRIRKVSPIEMVYETKKPTDFPADDVAEIQHGKWKGKPIAGYSTVRCSVCGEAYTENSGKWLYCPNCGAKMDGNENE